MTLREEQERVQKAVARSLAHVREDPGLAQRVLATAKGEEPMVKKMSVFMIIAAALIGLMAASALAAALNAWGIIDFASRQANVYVPPKYEESIRLENRQIDMTHIRCLIEQSYYDGKILRITANIAPKEDMLLLGADESPYDSVGDLFPGSEFEAMTLAEYALARHGGRMSAVSLGEADVCDLCWNGDGSMTIYIERQFNEEQAERDVSLTLSYLPVLLQAEGAAAYDNAARETAVIPMVFRSVAVKTFVCAEPMDFPSAGVRVNQVVMTVTPLEIRCAIDYEIVDLAVYAQQEDGLWFEFIDPNSTEMEYSAQRVSGGLTFEGGAGRLDGQQQLPDEVGTVYRQTDAIGLDALSDHYTLRAYNAWEKTRYEAVRFQVVEEK